MFHLLDARDVFLLHFNSHNEFRRARLRRCVGNKRRYQCARFSTILMSRCSLLLVSFRTCSLSRVVSVVVVVVSLNWNDCSQVHYSQSKSCATWPKQAISSREIGTLQYLQFSEVCQSEGILFKSLMWRCFRATTQLVHTSDECRNRTRPKTRSSASWNA